MKAGGILVVPSEFTLGKVPPSLDVLSIDFKAADGSMYSLAASDGNTTLTTDLKSLSTENRLREAEAFEVMMVQRISKESFSDFQLKLQGEIRKGEQ